MLIESPRIAAHIKAHFNDTLQSLSERGWTFIDPVDVAHAEEIVRMDPNEHLDVLTDSFREDLEGYLQTLIEVPTGVRTLEDVINFNDQHSVSHLPGQWLIDRLKSFHLGNAVSRRSSKLSWRPVESLGTIGLLPAECAMRPKRLWKALLMPTVWMLSCFRLSLSPG